MRRLASLVLLGLILVLPLPATAKPIATDMVIWTFDGGTVTLDTSTNTASVAIETTMDITCSGGQALANVALTGSAVIEAMVDQHGRSGSFTGTVELTPVVIVGACDYEGPTLTASYSGSFETDKGKADRWRENGDRHIRRTGAGVISVHSFVDVEAVVDVVRTIGQ